MLVGSESGGKSSGGRRVGDKRKEIGGNASEKRTKTSEWGCGLELPSWSGVSVQPHNCGLLSEEVRCRFSAPKKACLFPWLPVLQDRSALTAELLLWPTVLCASKTQTSSQSAPKWSLPLWEKSFREYLDWGKLVRSGGDGILENFADCVKAVIW